MQQLNEEWKKKMKEKVHFIINRLSFTSIFKRYSQWKSFSFNICTFYLLSFCPFTTCSSMILIPLHRTNMIAAEPNVNVEEVKLNSNIYDAENLALNLHDDNYNSSLQNMENKIDYSKINKNLFPPEVSVTVYHHQAIYDPPKNYEKGKPWSYLGHGYGLHYTYDHNGKHRKEKGFQYIKALGREKCQEGINCEPKGKSANKFQHHIFNLIGAHNQGNLSKWFNQELNDSRMIRRTPKFKTKSQKTSLNDSIHLLNTNPNNDHVPTYHVPTFSQNVYSG